MKTTKKIISLILTIQMLFACTLVPSAIATDSVMEEPIDEVEALVIDEGESPEELSPRMANEWCDSWYNEDGSRNYPPNYGFAGSYSVTTLPAGTLLAYYGAGISGYFCMPGTPASTLALPPWNTGVYNLYRLPQDTRFMYGTVASWGGSTGGGTQYVLLN